MKTTIFVIIFSLIFLFACNNKDIPSEYKELKITDKSAELVKADNEFGLEAFYSILNSDDAPGNVMISPLSISLALAMTYNGAENATKAAFEEVFNWDIMSRDEVNASYKALVDALLNADPKVTNEIANSIWIKEGFPILDDFKQVNIDYYYAEVQNRNFTNLATLDEINGWIEDKTHDKIKNMIDQIDPLHVMFLINAIYFKGTWTSEFNPEDSKKAPFYLVDGTSEETNMMGKSDTLNYAQNELFSSVELPYGTGNYNMLIFLPNQDKSCDDIAAEMNPDNWDIWMDSYERHNQVSLTMPKFKSEYKIKLNQVLIDMGLGDAFSTDADFSGMRKQKDLRIDEVQHKTFIEVNEEGTEAAAVTVVSMIRNTSIDPNPVIHFNVNRPFLYAIVEKSTGCIMFLGKIGNPNAG